MEIGKSISIQKPSAIIDEIVDTVAGFGNFTKKAGLDKKMISALEREIRFK